MEAREPMRPENTPERAAAILREREQLLLNGDCKNPSGVNVTCLWCGSTVNSADAIGDACFYQICDEAAKVGCEVVDTNEGLRVREVPGKE